MSNWREAVEQYPLAGHHGHCAKVVNGSVTATCTCGWDEERTRLLAPTLSKFEDMRRLLEDETNGEAREARSAVSPVSPTRSPVLDSRARQAEPQS